MRIGVFSDVHADVVALARALDLLRRHNVDQLVCAGDLVERGIDGDAVVKLLQAEAIPCVQGNHDVAAPGNQTWLREHGDFDNPNLLVRLLSKETLAYLQHLPPTLRFNWDNRRVLVAHGTPWEAGQYVFPTSRSPVFRRVIQEANADVVILGHTHLPMRVHVGAAWIVNPGSVCGPHASGSYTCAILTLPDIAFQVLDLGTGQPGTFDDITIP
jgi:putative phosphoesterase